MFTLKDKNALVCGSSHGIGQACANEIAKLGASVTLLARGEGALKEAVAGLSVEAGQTHGYLSADSADPEALQAVVTKHLQSVGTIHILVNNTGGPPSGPLLDAEPDQLLSGFRNHVLCNQLLVRTVAPGMKACGYGRIVNIISTSVLMPIGGLGVLIAQDSRDAMPGFFIATIVVAAGAMWILGVSVAQAAGRGGGAAMAHGFKFALIGWIPQHMQSGLPEGWREMYSPDPNLPR